MQGDRHTVVLLTLRPDAPVRAGRLANAVTSPMVPGGTATFSPGRFLCSMAEARDG
jgi:hypothetical protein